jgi:hypothetical protein
MPSRSLLIAVLALLAGCAKPMEVSSITEIKPSTGARGIDVHEPKRQSGQAGVPEFAGDQLLEVRTYTSKEGTGETEIAGATCELSAADFAATMQTPAKVRVPLYRGQSSTLAVACEVPGFKKRMITVAPFDATRNARYSGGASNGVIGLVAVTAIDAFSDNSRNEWRYPLARVVLEPDPAAKVAGQR